MVTDSEDNSASVRAGVLNSDSKCELGNPSLAISMVGSTRPVLSDWDASGSGAGTVEGTSESAFSSGLVSPLLSTKATGSTKKEPW